MPRYRVIQWATGTTGMGALRGLINHPDLDLVGLAVYSPEKDGIDAGEIAGLPPTGVLATTNHDALLALDADCVSYNPKLLPPDRSHETFDEVEKILRSGKNVVTSSTFPLMYPPASDPVAVARLEAACQDGGVSWFFSGIDPGFATDLLPLTVMGWAQGMDLIRVSEVADYSQYYDPETILNLYGFGKPISDNPGLFMSVVQHWWTPTLQILAEGGGIELDEIRPSYEGLLLKRDVDYFGHRLEKGTLGAIRHQLSGIVDGRTRILHEHITRVDPALAPDWLRPHNPEQIGSYRVEIQGDINFRVWLEIDDHAGNFIHGGCAATAMRLINAIPLVCAKPPGLLSLWDLPLVTGGWMNP